MSEEVDEIAVPLSDKAKAIFYRDGQKVGIENQDGLVILSNEESVALYNIMYNLRSLSILLGEINSKSVENEERSKDGL